MNNRTRFAKYFIIIVEQCKSWLLTFAENRVKALSTFSSKTTLEQFINANIVLSTDPMIKSCLNKMKTSSDLDISALRSIIIFGNLLHSGEMKTACHAGKTIGDYVDRIREIRNTFMHTASANLEELDYNDYLAEFCIIAARFEVENTEPIGWYAIQIEKIDKYPLDSEAVERTIARYNAYLQVIIKIEMPTLPTLLSDCTTLQRRLQRKRRNPAPNNTGCF